MSARKTPATAALVLAGGILMADQETRLPESRTTGALSVEEAIARRRSVREFREAALDLRQVSQLLWAAQGVTGGDGLRAAPSAGALYPLEVFLVVGTVSGLTAGTYRYSPERHALLRVLSGDRRADLARAALGQAWIREAPAVIVIAAVFARTTRRYGERGLRYVHMEVGHVAENIYLQAEALGLGTTMVGAFRDEVVAAALGLEGEEEPLGILPVGVPQ
jgi:SagB-type dehydrogenase family enzyme